MKKKWHVSQVQIAYKKKEKKVLVESLSSNTVFLSCNTLVAPVIVP